MLSDEGVVWEELFVGGEAGSIGSGRWRNWWCFELACGMVGTWILWGGWGRCGGSGPLKVKLDLTKRKSIVKLGAI